MARNRNSDIAGKPFDKTTVEKVWDKGYRLEVFDVDVWRYDVCGRPMRFLDYGKTDSEFGWEVDHIKPVAQGGSDDLSNLQPLQWRSNHHKGDTFPWDFSMPEPGVAKPAKI